MLLPKAATSSPQSPANKGDWKKETVDQRPWTGLWKFPHLDSTATLFLTDGNRSAHNVMKAILSARRKVMCFFLPLLQCTAGAECVELFRAECSWFGLCGRTRVKHWCGENLTETEAHSLPVRVRHEQCDKSETSHSLLSPLKWVENVKISLSRVTTELIKVLWLIPTFLERIGSM